MKNILLGSVVLLLMLCMFSIGVGAKTETDVDIPVRIDGGGTAVITPQVNSPVPEKSRVEVKDGETGHLEIHFTDPGSYAYTIRVEEKKAAGLSSLRLTITLTSPLMREKTAQDIRLRF